ncbi:hypothetical protein [Natronomonas sp. EA1]|uniref:hypothetical protein n=1 Tax=Natronomonas sp. EA1 TaxID=3421655 RepID=UPI003EBCEB0A
MSTTCPACGNPVYFTVPDGERFVSAEPVEGEPDARHEERECDCGASVSLVFAEK